MIRLLYTTRFYREGDYLVIDLEPRWRWVPRLNGIAERVHFDRLAPYPLAR